MSKKMLLVLILALPLLGCGGKRANWHHENFDMARYHRDRAKCKMYALRGSSRYRHVGVPKSGFMAGFIPQMEKADLYNSLGYACMESKGYYDVDR